MSEHTTHGTANARGTRQPVTEQTGWVGWIYFAATMLIMLGSFNAIEGLVALFNDQFYVPTRQGLLVFDITTWGWVHLFVGGLAVIAGVGLFTGAMWARVFGVILAGVNILAQLAFMSAYPAWGLIVITLDLLVIWALIVHGAETKDW